jgi:protein SCO1/2
MRRTMTPERRRRNDRAARRGVRDMSDPTPAPSAKRKFAWILALAAVGAAVVVGGRFWGAGTGGDNDVAVETPTPSAQAAPGRMVDFPCVERSGKAMRTADLAGQVVVADFMFTSCQATCPRLAAELRTVQAALAPGDDVRIVSFSVDPDRDSVAALAKYADDKGADKKRWLFLRSETRDLKKLMCDELHLANPDEPMLHSDRFVVFDASGVARGFYRPLDGVEPDWKTRLLADVAKLRGAAH